MSGEFPANAVSALGRPGFLGNPRPAKAGFVLRGAGVHIGSNFSVGNNNYTPITWDTVDFDVGGPFHSGATFSRLTVPAGGAGFYLATFNCEFAASTNGFRSISFQKNGARPPVFGEVTLFSSSGTLNTGWSISYVFNLVAGDFIEAIALQNSGGALNVVPASQQQGGAGQVTTFSLINIP